MMVMLCIDAAEAIANYLGNGTFCPGKPSSQISAWGGRGAVCLGLPRRVTQASLQSILNGILPDGTQVGDPRKPQRLIDLTFTLPISTGTVRSIGRDDRLLVAAIVAMKGTLICVEDRMGYGHTNSDSNAANDDEPHLGNLTYALFRHEPTSGQNSQAHYHVLIANITKFDGIWEPLNSNRIWINAARIRNLYNNLLRHGIYELGYETEQTSEDGAFQITELPLSTVQQISEGRHAYLTIAGKPGTSPNELEIMEEHAWIADERRRNHSKHTSADEAAVGTASRPRDDDMGSRG